MYEVIQCLKEEIPLDSCRNFNNGESYQVHFVREGSGALETGEGTLSLHEMQCFILFPHQSMQCRPSGRQSLCLSSLCMTGTDLAAVFAGWGLGPCSPLLDFDESCRAFYYIDEILANLHHHPGAAWRVKGNLLKILGELERFALLARNPLPFEHISRALHYADKHYMRPITVKDMAESVCLERSYFSRLFKEETGESPRDYLNRVRMDKAKELLISTSATVADVASAVGYGDSLHFSRRFKAYSLCSPAEYRKRALLS